MIKLPAILRLPALLPLALLLFLPGTAAADSYEAGWNGGHLIATANADFTLATIESVSASFDECGTATGETGCTWEAVATLHSGSERCSPSTPEDQIAWDSGLRTGNGTVSDGGKSFSLEGCRGQSLSMRIEFHKTYDETAGPLRITGGSNVWPLFTFGYHPFEEAEQRIIAANPPASVTPFQPNFAPKGLSLASDCRSLTIENVRYAFAFKRIGCRKASMLAQQRYSSAAPPAGYACNQKARGVLCWRQGQPQKYLEWHLPGTKPLRPRS